MNNTVTQAAFSTRKSIRRAIARFCYLKKINITDTEFEIVVRRTQESGYESAIKFFADKFSNETRWKRRQLLYQLSIEYNTEMYIKAFPKANKVIQNLLAGIKDQDSQDFFKNTLFDIVKANSLQEAVIDKYL